MIKFAIVASLLMASQTFAQGGVISFAKLKDGDICGRNYGGSYEEINVGYSGDRSFCFNINSTSMLFTCVQNATDPRFGTWKRNQDCVHCCKNDFGPPYCKNSNGECYKH